MSLTPNQSRNAGSQPITVLICTSPKAGRGQAREQVPILLERLTQAGYLATQTDSLATIRERIDRFQSAENQRLVIVACGGDGTVSLLADLATPEIPIVPMPMGTENLLARHFGYSADAEQVFQTIADGCDHRIDAGSANGRLFLVMATCGFDAEVVRDVHLRRRGHIHRLSYLRPILRGIARYRFPKIDLRIECDQVARDPLSEGDPGATESSSSSWQPCWAMIFNFPCYGGGLHIEPDAVGDDHLLDVITFEQGTLWSGLRYVAGILTRRHLGFTDVTRRRASRVFLSAPTRVPYQLDGDYVGRLPLKIETLPGRVCLRLPVGTTFSGRLSNQS